MLHPVWSQLVQSFYVLDILDFTPLYSQRIKLPPVSRCRKALTEVPESEKAWWQRRRWMATCVGWIYYLHNGDFIDVGRTA